MNSPRTSHFQRAMAALLVALATAAAYFMFTPKYSKPHMTALSERLRPLFTRTKTVCFGRFVINVPETADVVWGPAHVPLKTFRYPNQAGTVAEKVAEREKKLKSEERYPTGSGESLYKESLDGPVTGQKIVVGWRTFSDPFYQIDSFFPLGSDLYAQEADAYPDRKPEYEKLTSPERAVQALRESAKTMQPLREGDTPSAVGVCIDGAFLPGQLDEEVEEVAVGFRLKEFPDVHFSVETTRIDFPESKGQDLLSRQQRAESDAHKFGKGVFYDRVTFLRKDKRAIAGFEGFEILAHKPPDGDALDSHQFKFEYAGQPKNSLAPRMSVEMDTGLKDDTLGGQPPSLTDEEVLALWDKLTGSIRLRPTNANAHAAVPSKAAIGSLATTGRKCPQAGWWESVDDLPLAEPRGRFFCEGDPMPGIQVWSKLTTLDRLRGERRQHRAPTEWRLTSYDGPPKIERSTNQSPNDLPDAGPHASGSS